MVWSTGEPWKSNTWVNLRPRNVYVNQVDSSITSFHPRFRLLSTRDLDYWPQEYSSPLSFLWQYTSIRLWPTSLRRWLIPYGCYRPRWSSTFSFEGGSDVSFIPGWLRNYGLKTGGFETFLLKDNKVQTPIEQCCRAPLIMSHLVSDILIGSSENS